MAKFGHFGHKLYDQKYSNDGYPEKEHKQTNLPVKKLCDLDVWLKSCDQNKDFIFYKKNQNV